jgi:diguanylate cyclase (GGDEF)-like protein/PAS domain S-box-containing protein
VTTTVLIVEDEGAVAYELERAVRALDYSVVGVVATADEALAAVPYARPDLVLLDLELEGDVAVSAASSLRDRGVPVVFVTGTDSAAEIDRARAAGPYGFLFKPHHTAQLRATLETALERHRAERDLSHKTLLLEAVMRSIDDAIVAADESGRVLVFNDSAQGVLGYGDGAEENMGWFLPDTLTRCPASEFPLLQAMRGEAVRGREFFVRTPSFPDGRWYSVDATPLLSSTGQARGGVMVSRDVSRVKATQTDLERLSVTDPLTGTFNRRGFVSAARRKLEQSGERSSLFFVDLNGMKQINDTLGHAQGDQAILDVTALLRQCVGEADVIGRLGGDEFAVLAPTAESAESLAERLRSALDTFNQGEERQYRLSISIGRSSYHPDAPAPVESLVELADLEMYRDKEARRALRPSSTVVQSPSSLRVGSEAHNDEG